MRGPALAFLVAILALPVFGEEGPTDAEAYRFFQDLVSNEVGEILDKIRPALSSKARRIERETSFRVPLSEDLHRVHAFVDKDGQRNVEIGSGFGRNLFLTVEAFAIERYWDRPGFAWQHMNYVVKAWGENVERAQKGKAPLRVEAPYEMAGFGPDDMRRLDEDPEVSNARGAAFFQNLAWVVAHELAHHVLGHLNSDPSREFPEERSRSRDQEAAADRWALETLVAADLAPFSGIHALAFFYAMDQDALRREFKSTHPADIRRLQAMIDFAQDHVEEGLREAGASPDFIRRMKTELQQMLVEIEKEIGEGTPSGAELGSLQSDQARSLAARADISVFCDELTAAARSVLRGNPEDAFLTSAHKCEESTSTRGLVCRWRDVTSERHRQLATEIRDCTGFRMCPCRSPGREDPRECFSGPADSSVSLKYSRGAGSIHLRIKSDDFYCDR